MVFSPLPSCIREGFNSYSIFILMGHEQPDADCLCSQLALGKLLERLGKKVRLFAKGPFKRPEIRELEKHFETNWSFPPVEDTLLILLDCSSLERTGFAVDELEAFELMIIDHHASGSPIGKFRYIDPASPSTTLLIQGLWQYYDLVPDEQTSSLMLFGFATDTGFFRHLNAGSGPVFRRIAALTDQGASPNALFRRMNGGHSLGTRRLMGRLLERARFCCGGKVIFSHEDWKDREELETEDRDSDKLYQLLQSIEGCEAVAILRAESPSLTIIGLRSNHTLDVGRIAAAMGGGGHVKAAGCALEASMEEAEAKLLQLFEEQLT